MTLSLATIMLLIALSVILLMVLLGVLYDRDWVDLRSSALIISVVGFSLSVVLNYPGFMSYDSVEQILEARDGIYSDRSPPFMALLWHFTDRIVPGPLGMLLLQSALIWAGTFFITVNWAQTDRFTLFYLMPSIIIFYPPIFCISGAIWKDILMWAFFMLAIGIAGTREPTAQQQQHFNIWKRAVPAGMIFMGISARYNAVFAAIPIVILLILQNITNTRYRSFRFIMAGTLSTLLSIVLLFGATTVTHSLAQYQTSPWAAGVVWDISGIIYRMPDNQQQKALYAGIPARLRCSGSLDRMLGTYNPLFWQTMFWPENTALCCPTGEGSPSIHGLSIFDTCFELSGEEKSSLLQLWATSVIRHPIAWISHRLAVFKRVLGIDNPWSPVFMEPNGFDGTVAKIYGHRNLELNKLQSRVEWFFQGTSRRTLFYKPWLYLLIAIFVIIICIALLNDDRLRAALVALSGLAHEAGLFLVAPSAEYRYSHYMIYSSILASALLLQTFVRSRHLGLAPIKSKILVQADDRQ